ncbi:hypothetical protein [Lacihabitans soyangensis]|uniref:Uncharacterized protein n=1 Tax=Lacihabitans soyangensis TaxID=869394 RepID=A0AAE3GZ22_9BACT|nr:hypothetical protein [Lacihabitans soyangensis]MCP9761823.1 hypothetical protein [Lacihabitans soyangensis]
MKYLILFVFILSSCRSDSENKQDDECPDKPIYTSYLLKVDSLGEAYSLSFDIEKIDTSLLNGVIVKQFFGINNMLINHSFYFPILKKMGHNVFFSNEICELNGALKIFYFGKKPDIQVIHKKSNICYNRIRDNFYCYIIPCDKVGILKVNILKNGEVLNECIFDVVKNKEIDEMNLFENFSRLLDYSVEEGGLDSIRKARLLKKDF